MRFRYMVILAVVATSVSGTATAAPAEHSELLVGVRGFETWEVALDDGGQMDVVYWTATEASGRGAVLGGPAPKVGTEESGGWVQACYSGGCIFSQTVAPTSPAAPPDPLLTGGRRVVQMIVTDGPPGCVGSTATVTLTMTPDGPPRSVGRWTIAADPESPAVDLRGALYRTTAVGGSVISCLGTMAVASGPDNRRFSATFTSTAAMVSAR